MRRREFLKSAGLFTLLAASLPGCRRTRARRLIVSTYPRISMSGLYLAEELGLFEEQGLDVSLNQIPTGSSALTLLIAGEIDAMFASLSPAIINAVAKGARIRLVAGREIASSTCGNVGTIYGNRRIFPRGISDIRQLRGKRISVQSKASSPEFFLDTILATAAMSSEDVQVVNLRQQEGAAALVSGRVDALISSNFEKSLESLTDRAVKGISVSDIHPDLQYTFILFGRRLMDEEPETGVRFLTAYLLGAKAFLEGKNPQFLYEMIRDAHLDERTTLRECRKTFTPDGSLDVHSVGLYVRWAIKKGYCDPIMPERLVNSKLITAAQARAFQGKGQGG